MQYNIGKGSNSILGIGLLSRLLHFPIYLVYRGRRVGSSKTEIFYPADNRTNGDPKKESHEMPRHLILVWTAWLALPGAIPWNSGRLLVN
jgi:hypothetical protein